MKSHPLAVFKSLKFLVVGPMILAMLYFINLMVSPHNWWFYWAALGIGIAWVINLFRVLKAAALLGGLAALVAFLKRGKT